MRLVFFGESPADQAALAVFTEGILGQPLEVIDMGLESHGVTGILNAMEAVLRGVYYNSEAEALVVAVDSDRTDLHEFEHDKPGRSGENCRLCKLRQIITRVRGAMRPMQGRPELKVAIGLAVPAIEAWYLVGKNHQVGEAAWRVGRPFTVQQLKKLVYKTERPPLEEETKRAIEEARRIIGDISAIEKAFPNGFGLMAKEIRSWKAQ